MHTNSKGLSIFHSELTVFSTTFNGLKRPKNCLQIKSSKVLPCNSPKNLKQKFILQLKIAFSINKFNNVVTDTLFKKKINNKIRRCLK